MKRSFEDIINTLSESIATYDYFVDFKKVYKNVSKIEMQLNLLNYLIGKDNIEEEFTKLLLEYPDVIEAIPILLAVREGTITVTDGEIISYTFRKNKLSRAMDDYITLFRESGLEKLFKDKKIKNLVDYVTGVEVGMDTNARKNRTGTAMENIVESYIENVPEITYKTQVEKEKIKDLFGVDLGWIKTDDIINGKKAKDVKKFDFVIKSKSGHIYVVETNYYNKSGSKQNETSRGYIRLEEQVKQIDGVDFIWITDGQGWKPSKNELATAYDNINHIYTLADLENGILEKIIN